MSLVKLLRMKKAAHRLAYRNEKKIIDIAFSSGFESHEAFSRAFKRYFGQSPSAFRADADWSYWQTKYEPLITLRKKLMNNTNEFDVSVIESLAVDIAVLEHKGSPVRIGKSIQQFIAWRKENKNPPSVSRTFNLVYDDPTQVHPDDYRFDIGCSVNRKVEVNRYGVVNKTIPEGKCAVIRHIGSDDSIGVVVNFLYSSWLPHSPYQLRDFPIFFERVRFFPEVAEHETVTDVYLPIEESIPR